MKELVKIKEHNGQRLVDARELHCFLGSKQDFSTWVKNRIEKYKFIMNQDYVLLHKIMEQNGSGGHNVIDYGLTIDMSKELCMVENNEKGRKARRYFIEMEKLAKNTQALTIPSRKQLAEWVIELENQLQQKAEQMQLQESVIKQSVPKIEYYEEVLQSKTFIAANVIAKELGMSAVSLNRLLHQLGIIYKSGGTWVLYHKYQNKGYTGTKTTTYIDYNGIKQTAVHTYWTEKGREFIHKVVAQYSNVRNCEKTHGNNFIGRNA